MLCVGWRLGVDFLVKVGRHEAEAQGAFAAVNLPSEKCPVLELPSGRALERGVSLLPASRPL